MKPISLLTLIYIGLLASRLLAADWQPITVPGTWEEKGPAAAKAYDGVGWYRTWVKAPANYFNNSNKYTEIKYAETVGVVIRDLADAYEVYINGVKLGTGGRFPPNYKSGRNEAHRFKVPLGTLRKDQWNEIAIKVYNPSGPGGFLGEAPRILNIFVECVFAGPWEFSIGDGYQPGGALTTRPTTTSFDQFVASNFVLGKLEETDPGPKLSPQEALAQMKFAPDLKGELILHEPEVTQPAHMSFDERGRLWVTQYRQYPYPAGLKIVGRSASQEAIFDRVPPSPPYHDRGADIISIHEDTDGDGLYDKRTVFQEGLNMANAAVRGRGGVWVMNPPYLLFYPDKNFDDVPDGPPEVRLQGFGLEDTHSVANGLVWGPDGWLYGGQGSTTTSRVTRPGLDGPDAEGVFFDGSMVWRYHPDTREYDIFVRGGGNTFGLELDAQGRLYSGYNGGKTRGFHYVQNGYFTLQRPGASEMYAFGQLPYMHPAADVARFSHFGAFVEGTAMPAKYQGHLFALDPLHNEVIDSERIVGRSTFETRDLGRVMSTQDPAFRPLYAVNAPDGSMLISDMYEYYTAHRNHYQSQIDPTTGRIYRLRAPDAPLERDINLAKKSSRELVALLSHPNKWHRQTAVRILGERKDQASVALLQGVLAENRDLGALNALWALYQIGRLDDRTAQAALDHSYPSVRLWAVRFIGDKYGVNRGLGLPGLGAKPVTNIPAAMFTALSTLAQREPDAEVRAQVASTAQRLITPQSLQLVATLATHDEDATDPYIPLLTWWALEAQVRIDRAKAVEMFKSAALWDRPMAQQHLLSRLMRRLALEGRPDDLLACAQLLRLAPTPQHSAYLMKGFEEAYRGRTMDNLPDELVQAMVASGRSPLALRLRQGDATAVKEALAKMGDKQADLEDRLACARIFGEVKTNEAVPALLAVAEGNEPDTLRKTALVALAGYDQPEIGAWAAALLPGTKGDLRTGVLALMASRARWSRNLLHAVENGQIATDTVPPDIVDRMRGHNDPEVYKLLNQLFPRVAASNSSDLSRRIAEVRAKLKEEPGNARAGESVFAQTCAACHTLFAKGGKLGPDLNPYQRDNLETLLVNIINPNAEIREGFQYHMVVTKDGRSLSGFLVSRDTQIVVLRGLEGEDITLRQAEIKSLSPVSRSLMPEGLLDNMDGQKIRDLFAYLRLQRGL